MLDILDQTDVWTPKAVCSALADAYRVLSATEGRVGHKRVKAAWPDYKTEFGDEVGQQVHKTFKKTMLPRLRPSSFQIQHMELALIGGTVKGTVMPPWLNGLVLSYPTGRKKLVAGSMARAHRYSGRQLCEAMGWNEATYRWQRDKAAGLIAQELNSVGLKSW